jgi:hypothetical protein
MDLLSSIISLSHAQPMCASYAPALQLSVDKSLAQFCAAARQARKNPGNGMKLTEERTAAFDAVDFNWTTQEYVTRSFG